MQSIKRFVLTKNNCVWSIKQQTTSVMDVRKIFSKRRRRGGKFEN